MLTSRIRMQRRYSTCVVLCARALKGNSDIDMTPHVPSGVVRDYTTHDPFEGLPNVNRENRDLAEESKVMQMVLVFKHDVAWSCAFCARYYIHRSNQRPSG